jgi:tetratricopeptide (TPR) repeat protein
VDPGAAASRFDARPEQIASNRDRKAIPVKRDPLQSTLREMTMARYPMLTFASAVLLAVVLAGTAHAAGGNGGGDGSDGGGGDGGYDADTSSEAYGEGMDAANAGNWDLAITKFTIAITEDPASADCFNMLAYSYRNKGDYDQAFRYYDRALSLNPDHANAHEYVGEAYLAVGDLPKAEEHLAALDDICWLGCDQYDDLAEAIETYKASN